MEILLLLLVGVIFAAFSATLAGAKGYSQSGWAWAGLFFGPIALLTVMGLPDLELRKYVRRLAEHQGAVIPEDFSVPPDWENEARAHKDGDPWAKRP